MPTYDYKCDGCGHKFEEMQSFSAEKLKTCPKCGEDKLQRLFGNEAASPIRVLYKDWAADPNTATAADASAPKSHPAYGGHVLPGDTWSRALVLAGSETAGQQGGYLEGALQSAEAAVRKVLVLRQVDTPRPDDAHGRVDGPKQTEPRMP